jgi:hypothetical protein
MSACVSIFIFMHLYWGGPEQWDEICISRAKTVQSRVISHGQGQGRSGASMIGPLHKTSSTESVDIDQLQLENKS